MYMMRRPTLQKSYAHINWLLDRSLNTQAEQELDALSSQLPDGEYWSSEYERFSEMVDQKVLWSQQEKKLTELDSTDRAQLEEWAELDDMTGAIAKNLLAVNFGDEFYLDPIELGSSGKRADAAAFDQINIFSAEVYPNPAESYVSFTFNGSLGHDITLSIMDQQGREVKRVKINGKAPVKTISTTGLPAGQYIYRAVAGEARVNGKLTITK
jgi:hypothetical protein